MSNGNGKTYKVGIIGSYGGLNLGDEAILQCIIAQLRRSLPVEITVFSRKAKDTLARHRVERAVDVREMSRNEIAPAIKRLDLLILGGGGILFDSEAHVFLREVMLAEEMGVPVMVYAVSAGPLEKEPAQELVRDALNGASAVTVRERKARQLLEQIGVTKEIAVTADPALLLKPEPLARDMLKREGLEGKRRLVGISVREKGAAAPDLDERQYHALIANAADYMVSRLEADLVFVPMEPKNADVQHSHAVISQMANAGRAHVLKGEYSPAQVLALMRHFSFAVGMRLHFLIFAAIQHVPFVALPYASKVSGFLEALELSMPPVQKVNAGELIAFIDRSWDLRRQMQQKIRRLLPELQERASQTNDIAVELLKRTREPKRMPEPEGVA